MTVPMQGAPAYRALFPRGVAECVIALGFHDGRDEPDRAASGASSSGALGGPSIGDRVAALSNALRRRGYVEGSAAAQLAAIGRDCPEGSWVRHFFKPNAVRTAAHGVRHDVGLVVRIVGNVDGESGSGAAASLMDGLSHAAICMYMGHWRFGLGADFDPAYAIAVRDEAQLPSNPRRLARAAALEAKRRGEAVEATLDRWRDQDRIRIARTNSGRVAFGRQTHARHDPMARLAHWIATRSEGVPASAIADAASSRRANGAGPDYSLWILLSCRSAHAFPEIRRSLAASRLGLVGAPGNVMWQEWEVLPWLLDALCAGGDWNEIQGVVEARIGGEQLVVDA